MRSPRKWAQEPHSPSGCLLRMSYKIRKRERTATCPAKPSEHSRRKCSRQRGYALPQRGNDGKGGGPSGNRSRTEKATILIAEDTDSNFDLLNAILGRKYHLVRAKDGMEAVTMYDEVNPDLILMDIKMPNLDGLEATRIIRQLSAEVPIIAQSAYAYEHDRMQPKKPDAMTLSQNRSLRKS